MYLSMLRAIKDTLPSYTLVFIRKERASAFLSFIKKNTGGTYRAIKIKLYMSDRIMYNFECIGFTEKTYDTELRELRLYLNLVGSSLSHLSYYVVRPISDSYYLFEAGAPYTVCSSKIFNRYMKRVNRHKDTNKDITA